MNKLLSSVFMVLVCFFMISSVATANIIDAGDYIRLTAWNGLNGGGIMTYEVSDNINFTNSFLYKTFCIQDNVYITPSTTYTVASISNHLVVPNGTELLNSKVDYVFDKFSDGAYNLTNQADQAKLQDLLWSLQGNIQHTGTFLPTDAWTIDANHYPGGSFGTMVINIVDANGNNIQNQLYHQVPEPATMLLFGMGLLGAGIMRKKING